MHGHGSARAERVRSGVFWGEAKSDLSQSQALGSDDGNDIGCADGLEAMIGGITADGGGGITPLVAQAVEDVDARLDWACCGRLGTEVGYGLAPDGILMIVEGEENLSGPVEMLGRSVPGEEKVTNKEHDTHKGPELDRPAVAGALRVFIGTEAEVEDNGDQVGNVVGSGVREGICLGDNGVHDSQGGGLFSSDGGVFEPVGLELLCEALVDPGVCLGVSKYSGVGQTIQEVGRCNCPPCLIKRLFPKSFHPELGVIDVPNPVAVDLEELDARGGWILESRIERQGGAEVSPLAVQPLLSRIFSSAGSHGFLCSVDITQ